jgi:hypothetical protein
MAKEDRERKGKMKDDRDLEVNTPEARTYMPPQIVAELELETRAGSSLSLPDELFDPGE